MARSIESLVAREVRIFTKIFIDARDGLTHDSHLIEPALPGDPAVVRRLVSDDAGRAWVADLELGLI